MGNCSGLILRQKPRKRIVLLLVGLDNAGKTTAAKSLAGEAFDSVVPTVGFSSFTLKYRRHTVILYDLGGGPRIRGIWHRYFADVHGVIFVVDASDVTRMSEGRKLLENLLAHDKLAGKPVLLLANKQDCENALDELDVVDKLNLEAVVNQYRCPTLVEICSAAPTSKVNHKRKWRKRVDPGIQSGYRWIVNVILRDYEDLNTRVEKDTAEQTHDLEVKRKRRLEHIEQNGNISAQDNGNISAEDKVENPVDVKVFNNLEHNSNVKSMKPVTSSQSNEIETVVPGCIAQAVSTETVGVNYITIDNSEEKDIVNALSLDPVPNDLRSITDRVREHLQLDTGHKQKKRKFLRKLNKTAPAPMGEPLVILKKPLPALGEKKTGSHSAPLHSVRTINSWRSSKSVDEVLLASEINNCKVSKFIEK